MGKPALLKTLMAFSALVWAPTVQARALESRRPPPSSLLLRSAEDPMRSNLETLRAKAVLSTFNKAIQQAELEDQLQGATVIMPWNRAWEQEAILGKIMSDQQWSAHLQSVLLYHIINDGVSYESMGQVQSLSMENGDSVSVEFEQNQMKLQDAQIIAYDQTTDGYAYMTKKVLMPTFLSQSIVDVVSTTDLLSTLKSLLVTAGLDNVLNAHQRNDPVGAAMTVWAPSNEAFAADPDSLAFLQTPEGHEALENLLLYHVTTGVLPSMNIENGSTQVATTLTGAGMKITNSNGALVINDGQARVSSADNLAMEGVVHTLDAVLVPHYGDANGGYGRTAGMMGESAASAPTTFLSMVAGVGLLAFAFC